MLAVELVLAGALELGLVDLVENEFFNLTGSHGVLDDAQFEVVYFLGVSWFNLLDVDAGGDNGVVHIPPLA